MADASGAQIPKLHHTHPPIESAHGNATQLSSRNKAPRAKPRSKTARTIFAQAPGWVLPREVQHWANYGLKCHAFRMSERVVDPFVQVARGGEGPGAPLPRLTHKQPGEGHLPALQCGGALEQRDREGGRNKPEQALAMMRARWM